MTKKVTFSLPEELLKQSKEYAKKHGTTLNQMFQDFLKRSVWKNQNSESATSASQALIDHAKKTAVNSGGYKWNREDAYER